ncbi:hypothetical protein QQ045_023178 [Rhodiola kirilowii]
MKLSTALRVKRTQFMRWVKNNASSNRSIVPFTHIEAGNYTDRRLFVLKQLIWKLKSQWKKQSLKWQASKKICYNYDLKSYSQNFDEGHLK